MGCVDLSFCEGCIHGRICAIRQWLNEQYPVSETTLDNQMIFHTSDISLSLNKCAYKNTELKKTMFNRDLPDMDAAVLHQCEHT